MLKLDKRIGQFFLIFLFMYFRFSLWFLGTSETIQAFLSIFLLITYQLIFTQRFVLKQKSLIMFLTMLLLILTSCLINYNLNNLELGVILQWVIALLIVNTLSKQEFCESYVSVICLLSIFSLIVFFLELSLPSFIEIFPYVTATKWIGNGMDGNIRNIYIGIAALGANYKRNWGIFYEPGMYAFFLNFAIFLELFVSKNTDKKKIIILMLALLTTLSTNGYISLFLIMFAFILQRKNAITYNKKLKFWMIKLGSVIVLFVTVFFAFNPERWFFFISKLGEWGASAGSGYERISALKYAWFAFLHNPITGISSTKISGFYNGNISTFTPLQWFATYGLIYGLICNVCLGLTAFNDKKLSGNNIIKCIALFTMIFSQNMTSNSIVLAFIIYNATNLFGRKRIQCFQS